MIIARTLGERHLFHFYGIDKYKFLNYKWY